MTRSDCQGKNQISNRSLKKNGSPRGDPDDEALKREIDEIMSTVDTILDKVAQVIPEDKQEIDGQG